MIRYMDNTFRPIVKQGQYVFTFCSYENKIEARRRLALTLAFLIPGLFLLIAGIVVGALPNWGALVMSGMGLFFFLGLIESREKITIDSFGVTTKGVAWPRPCKISWSEMHKVFHGSIVFWPNAIGFYTKDASGKVKLRAAVPATAEVLFAVSQHYPRFTSQFLQQNTESS